jgi:hypothetical protein
VPSVILRGNKTLDCVVLFVSPSEQCRVSARSVNREQLNVISRMAC